MKSWLKPKYVTYSVNDEPLRFYPISVGLFTRLKVIGEPLIRMFAKLQDKLLKRQQQLSDAKYISTEDTGSGFKQTTSEIKGVSVEILQIQKTDLEEIVRDVVETIFEKDTPRVLAEVIVDSLREEYPRLARGALDQEAVDALHSELDLGSAVQLLTGVAKANEKGLGPFGKMLLKSAKDEEGAPSQNEPPSSPKNTPPTSPGNEERNLLKKKTETSSGTGMRKVE